MQFNAIFRKKLSKIERFAQSSDCSFWKNQYNIVHINLCIVYLYNYHICIVYFPLIIVYSYVWFYTITRTIIFVYRMRVHYSGVGVTPLTSHPSEWRPSSWAWEWQLPSDRTEAVGPKVQANYKRFVSGERANNFGRRGKAALWKEICSAVARVSASRFWLHAFGSLLINSKQNNLQHSHLL